MEHLRNLACALVATFIFAFGDAYSIEILNPFGHGASLPKQNDCEINCGFEIGDDPKVSDFTNSSQGPYETNYIKIKSRDAKGFGGGFIFYPKGINKKMALIAVSPPLSIQSEGLDGKPLSFQYKGKKYLIASADQAQRFASYGFIAFAINTNSSSDIGFSRSKQLERALKYAINLGKKRNHILYGKIDESRLGMAGHSNGGDGALNSASKNNISAVVALAPSGIPLNKFYKIKVPSFISVCNLDPMTFFNLVPAWQYYKIIPNSTKKAYMTSLGFHECNINPFFPEDPAKYRTVNFYSIAWMKRYLDKDHRYEKFLCGFDHGNVEGFDLINYVEGNCD